MSMKKPEMSRKRSREDPKVAMADNHFENGASFMETKKDNSSNEVYF